MAKQVHTKRISHPPRSAKELSGRHKQTSIKGGKRKTTSNTPLPSTTHKTLTQPPPLPPEIAEHKSARIYWRKYWSYLIEREQAVQDFIPTITTLCILRNQMSRLQISLDAMSPVNKMAIAGQKNLITFARNITALEAEHGFTLATHSISQSYNPSQTKDETPQSTNALASRATNSNPYEVPDSSLFDDDDED